MKFQTKLTIFILLFSCTIFAKIPYDTLVKISEHSSVLVDSLMKSAKQAEIKEDLLKSQYDSLALKLGMINKKTWMDHWALIISGIAALVALGGFFLSMIGKIVVDEKKLYSVLSELRSLQFEMESEAKTDVDGKQGAMGKAEAKGFGARAPEEAGLGEGAAAADEASRYARAMRLGAEQYAAEVLDNLDQTMQKMMVTLIEGKKLLQQRLSQEVKRDGTTEV